MSITHQTPLILVKESRKALYVSDMGEREYELGIRLSMPLAYAKAIVPDIAHYLHNDDDFRQAFAKLALSAMRFSPHVAIDDYGLLLNITGCAHLFGNETFMLTIMSDFFRKQSLNTHIAIAPYPLLAKALAHFAPNSIVSGKALTAINALPTAALFIDDAIIAALKELAISTMKDLLRLPRKMLAQRFGLGLIQRIDQLQGVIEQPPNYLEENPHFCYREDFSSPIRTHEHFMEASSQLLTQALHKLCSHHVSLKQFTLATTDIFGKTTTFTMETSTPHNTHAAWLKLLHLKTENQRFNQGIDNLRLHVTHHLHSSPLQRHFSHSDNAHEAELSFVADKIKARLGDRALFHLRIRDNHLPEQAVVKDHSLAMNVTATMPLPPRPVRLFSRPIPVSVIALLPDNPPAKILWKDRALNVLHSNGPERIESPWWCGDDMPARDYYYVEDERGKRLWLYSQGSPKQWFIHGIFP